VLRLEKGKFGFTDQIGARFDGTQRLLAELTLRDGKVVYDLNGMTREQWDKIPAGGRGGDPRWDSFTSAGRGGNAGRGDQKKQ
jgi:dihydroorotase